MNMYCQYLERCFKESINKVQVLFEKDRCTHKEDWLQCPLYLERKKTIRSYLNDVVKESFRMYSFEFVKSGDSLTSLNIDTFRTNKGVD